MRVTRDVMADDLIWLRAYLKRRPDGAKHRRYEYLSYLGFFTVVGFGILATAFARSSVATPWLFALSPLLGLPLCHVTWLYLDRRMDQRFVRANEPELGAQEFWVSEEGFGNKTPAGSAFHVWKDVPSVEETPAFIFVAARANLYTVPVGSEADEEYARFAAELRSQWRAGRERAAEQRDEADKATLR